MERLSDPAHTAPIYEDILARLDRIEALLVSGEWEVDYTIHERGDDDVLPPKGEDWEPFAVSGNKLWWRRRS